MDKTFTVVLKNGSRYAGSVIQYVKKIDVIDGVNATRDHVAFLCSGYIESFPADQVAAIEL